MPLQFPTMAEQALAKWQSQTRTTPLEKITLPMGADIERDGTTIIHTFDDDTSLIVTGRGKNYQVRAELP